jgi:secreted PhoX family phosphatase
MKRRHFLEFLGKGVVATSLLPPFISSCNKSESTRTFTLDFSITGIQASKLDQLLLADGLTYKVLLTYGQKISDKDSFGYDNDYIAFIPSTRDDEGMLWVNHESIVPLFVSNFSKGEKTKEQIEKEMYNVGGTFVKLKNHNGQWNIVFNDTHNRRFNAFTEIPFNWNEKIMGKSSAIGTMENCAGGITPWGTILTCEENYHNCYGERNFKTNEIIYYSGGKHWHKLNDYPPEHYGWVVEVDPKTGKAQKHVALGRCAHECATVVELEDKRVVVYSGDDKADQCLYKFISDEPGSLKSGTLYVANIKKGKWISLKYEDQEILRNHFSSQTEVLLRLREAAELVGGSPLDRPEDIEIDPVTGNVFVALTKNKPKGNYFGEILKIEEDGGQYDSLNFKANTFLTGGKETGFACPDNLAFDRAGNLWFTCDISGDEMNKPPYESFMNNGLYVMPRTGPQSGNVIQIASAPVDSELTGPFFAPDGKTLFLSVQHPGSRSKSLDKLTSNWPDGGNSIPRPSVVTISGPLLNQIQGLS